MREGLAARGSLGMAGAAAERQEVWLGAWRAEALPGDPHGVRLHVPGRGFALDLELRAEREPVLHGVDGLDQKGGARGNASWYYSLTRLAAEGWITVGGKTRAVRGMAWMDHEFGTTELAAGNAGWDWLGLRLSDGSDLMLYRLRRKDGAPSPHSAGTWVDPRGRGVALSLAPGSGTRLPPPEVRGPAGFHHHRGRSLLGEKARELSSGEAMAPPHPPRPLRHRDLEHGLGQIHRDRRRMHLGLLLPGAFRGARRLWHSMPRESREESISSLTKAFEGV